MSERIVATARVRVVLEIPLNDTWGNDCTVAQVQKQARDGVRGLLASHKLSINSPELHRAEVIGEPEVIAVLVAAR